jgi:hypothetical protein
MIDGINSILNAAGAFMFSDATYYAKTWATDPSRPHDKTPTAPDPDGEPCKAQIDDSTWSPSGSGGSARSTRRIMVLCSSLPSAPKEGDEIGVTVPGSEQAERHRLGALLERDPAGVYWLFEVVS